LLTTPLFTLSFTCTEAALWTYTLTTTGAAICVSAPILEIDGTPVSLLPGSLTAPNASVSLGNGISESRFEGTVAGDDALSLAMIVRTADGSPFIRFRYEITSKRAQALTKVRGRDAMQYLSISLRDRSKVQEIRFSEFNELFHSFCLVESDIDDRHFDNVVSFMGPILTASGDEDSLLIAYEHGSQLPDRFVEFVPQADRNIALRAVKGNHYAGQPIGPGNVFQTIWMQIGMAPGNIDALAGEYRAFVLIGQSLNTESRKPYIYYNTWNYQERNQDWNKKAYLDSMNAERMLAEIDAAHRMGIDVFVIDTGWYEKTGDWRVNRKRFPEGLKPLKDKLDSYGMKLGLWFNPIVAAVTSRMRLDREDCRMSWNGKVQDPFPIWETEESVGMCLVSRYADAFADELIRLYNEEGVTYFKWDAIGQYGCSDPRHNHGTAENSEVERTECYAFTIGTAMADVVDKLCAACPEAIVDFDITEGARCVGLSFLSTGKYFLINNGPYYHNYDIPAPPNRNINMFFFPGPARGWICRTPLNYDRWIPSVLFLTHYMPDDPAENQWITLASLILGQNGIWGDLLSVSDEGIERLGGTLALYKQIRDDVTKAIPVRSGPVGGSPEVHEKIAQSGRGVVSVFASAPGTYTYVTQSIVSADMWHTDNCTVRIDSKGRAVIEAAFNKPSAVIVMFGIADNQLEFNGIDRSFKS